MRRINQIVLTVYEANRLATAANPHLHRLALILLDNVIEIQLRRKANLEFAFDKTYWFSGVRKHNKKRRWQVSRFHAELLKLAVEQQWITENDSKVLGFAHRLRNKTYHEGFSEDETELTLGITLLFRFVYETFPKWQLSVVIQISPHEPIPIENAADDSTGFAPLIIEYEPAPEHPFTTFGADDDATWRDRLNHCITFDHRSDVRPLLKKRIENLLDRIQHSIDFITEYDDTDFNAVMAQRFTILTPFFSRNQIAGKTMTNPVTALNIYVAILGKEQELLDVEDEQERADRFHKTVNDHEYDPDILDSLDLHVHYRTADDVLNKPEADGVSAFLKINRTLENFAQAAEECATDLDEYIQHMIDVHRGK